MEISCIAAYNDYSSPIEEHRENELLMTREQIRLAVDLGAPIVRLFAFWSGVTLRDGCITYDVARHNIDHRYPGTTALERWCYVRECLTEAAKMAENEGITLALQNHEPIIKNYQDNVDMLAFIEEVNSPALKACLDRPLLKQHSEDYYRAAIRATGDLMVHTHYGGRFGRLDNGTIVKLRGPLQSHQVDDAEFLRIAKEGIDYSGHIGYELCSPVLIGHRHAGLDYALGQAKLACDYMRQILDSI